VAIDDYSLQYVVSPILLTGGAAAVSGGTIPIMSITDSLAFGSLLGGGPGLASLNDAFAHYHPLPGAALEAYDLGEYPFASQITAANAIITKPLNISMMMVNPRRQAGDYANFPAVMQALKQTIDQHVLAGGTFTVLTPAYPFTNCVLRRFADASGADSKQGQWRWQWDFEMPLIALAQASAIAQNQNNLMGQLTNGQATANAAGQLSWSGVGPTSGNPGSTAAPSTVPASASSPTLGGNPGNLGT